MKDHQLSSFIDLAGSQEHSSNPNEWETQWNNAAMRALAAAVETRHGEDQYNTQGLVAQATSHLPDCATFQDHRAQYYPALPPMDRVHVKMSILTLIASAKDRNRPGDQQRRAPRLELRHEGGHGGHKAASIEPLSRSWRSTHVRVGSIVRARGGPGKAAYASTHARTHACTHACAHMAGHCTGPHQWQGAKRWGQACTCPLCCIASLARVV